MAEAQFAVARTMVADKRWVGCRIVAATIALVVALAVHGVAISIYINAVVSSSTSTREYDLDALPSTYNALSHPVRRVVIQTDHDEISMNIIATKLFDDSYMELYSEDSVVVHVDVVNGVYLSFPESDANSETPFVQSLRGLEQAAGTYDSAAFDAVSASSFGVASNAEHGRKLALRIGRFYICIFCRGSWRCKGSVRNGRVRGSCRRLIAIGFDAER